ncbi:MAG: methionine gamma-lyase family protein, partial [Oscillospiraceae bacterium]|nr:methionine gamma-lyase family protein [Oscillospiraceae bacterium]
MSFFEFSPEIVSAAERAAELCEPRFAELDRLAEYNGQRVLKAFIDNRVSDIHMKGTNGYGYGDEGRDKLDAVFAQVLGAEDAIVRHNFVNGTHALTTALFGVLRPRDTMLSVTGMPYDTMQEVVLGENCGSLRDFGVNFGMVKLLDNGMPDCLEIAKRAPEAKLCYIQRSRGYSLRPSFDIDTIDLIVRTIRNANKDCIIMVDNCYGELVEDKEPTAVGADIIVGSLIKNLGGGIAETGGYIAGRADLIEQCSYRLTCPGAGKEVGCSLNQLRGMYMGLFHAPEAVCAALKTSVFAAAFFELLGYEAFPKYDEKRTDIIAALKLGGEKQLIAFCEGIQSGSPVDSFAAPEPWDMPGYDSKVIMAAGAFTMGASIELSADAPLREPYAVWLQGGLTFPTGKTGIMLAAQRMVDKG